MEAYLDNSATTRCSDRACQLMVDLLTKDYGNPSSLHMKGIEAERFVETAKKKIAKTLRVSEKEIILHPVERSQITLRLSVLQWQTAEREIIL